MSKKSPLKNSDDNLDETREALDAGLYQISAPCPPLIEQLPTGGSCKRSQIPFRKLYYYKAKIIVVAVPPARAHTS